MTKTILGAGALALALTGGAFAFGRGGGGHGGCGHDMLFGGRMLHALDLSADQRQKVDDIFTAHRPKLQQLFATDKAASQAVADEPCDRHRDREGNDTACGDGGARFRRPREEDGAPVHRGRLEEHRAERQ